MEFLVLLAIISKCLPLIPLLNELIMKDHFAIFDECLNIKEGQVRISNVKLWFFLFFFFSIWVFFHEHSRFTGQQGKGEGIYLTPLYHFHPLHRDLDISRAMTAESSPLHIAGSRTRTGNLWFPSASR